MKLDWRDRLPHYSYYGAMCLAESTTIQHLSQKGKAYHVQWNPSYPDPAYPGTSVIRTTNLTPKIKININGVI